MSFKQLRQICAQACTQARRTIQSSINPGLQAVVIVSVTVTGMVMGLKHLGWLQPLELRAYDRLVRFRPDEGIDSRLLIVAFTEEDIQRQNRRIPSDQDLATVLAILNQHQPQVIGLDLYRDVPEPPGTEQLRDRFQDANLIAITKLGNEDEGSIPPPPGLPYEQIGFNDLLIDPDGVIRRNLLFGSNSETTYFSFSLRLALNYLQSMGITPQPSAMNQDYMQLGSTTFDPMESTSGGYQGIDDRGYQILLNYRSQRYVARQITFTQVLEQGFDPTWVEGKIVLIGNIAPSGKDLFYTPYSAAEETDHQMTGVELHAQSVSQILSAALGQRPLIWFWAEGLEGLWIAGWALLGGSLAWWLRHPLALGLSGISIFTVLSGSCFLVLTHQGWIPIVAPALASFLSVGAVVTYRAQQAHRQQQVVMTLLGQNTSPEIANALWDARDRLIQSGKLPGQRLTATMLFTDIKGFSTVAEQMTPEDLLDWLNEYLEAMTHVIQRYHGIINKFTGDGLLAIFGVPIPQLEATEIAQDAYHAVACALAMGDRLHQLNQDWLQRGLTTVQMRVGIFTGPVVVGSLGGKDRMEYGVIGDSVNTASRLEGCVKDRQPDICRVLIAQETLNYVQGNFVVESWGPMSLKGKQQLVEVYRVIRHAIPSSGIASTQLGTPVLQDKNLANPEFEAETKLNSVNL